MAVRVEFFVQFKQTREFLDGCLVVFCADVDVAVILSRVATFLPHDQQGAGLSPALVTTGGLSGGKAGHEPVSQLGIRLSGKTTLRPRLSLSTCRGLSVRLLGSSFFV